MKMDMTLQQMMFRCRDFTLDFSQRPHIMSVLNLTPDSFSDGGKFYRNEQIDFDAVCEVALQMERDGADILDIGGESTRPGAVPVSADEEKRRILPAIERISKKFAFLFQSIPRKLQLPKRLCVQAPALSMTFQDFVSIRTCRLFVRGLGRQRLLCTCLNAPSTCSGATTTKRATHISLKRSERHCLNRSDLASKQGFQALLLMLALDLASPFRVTLNC